jgi:ATPase subunit of ABC transporter with duplicated ATPase domains
LLRAISEKLIPGIPQATKISVLQQTEDSSALRDDIGQGCPVLQHVLESATSVNAVQHEIKAISEAINDTSNKYAPVHAIRQVRHEKLKKQLFEKDKDARLRSGARGMQARKALIAFEKTVAESEALLHQENLEIDEDTIKEETQAAIELLGELQSIVEPSRMAELEKQAKNILIGLSFTEEMMSKSLNTLSGGWLMRTSLATALLCGAESDILILDEPTNFLDLFGILWLQKYLLTLEESNKNTTIILVSHDRDFVDAVCQEIIILKDQSLAYFHGNITAYEQDQQSRKLYLGRMKEAQDRQRSHIEKTIQQNIKAGKATGDDNKLRQAKSRQKKLDDRMGLQVSANGGRFKLNRDLEGYHLTSRAKIEVPADEKGVSLILPLAPDLRFPGPLISLENVHVKYKSASKPTLESINFVIHTGDRVGIVGLNGSGKSTLIKVLVDKFKPSKGIVTRHPRLRLGYYSQHAVEDLRSRGLADASLTALVALKADAGDELDEGECRGLLGSLGLPGHTASDVPVAKLSGGQLVRLALALILWKSPQLLILDEVTTHLDFYTVTALANALSSWNGAILLVSHDRYLIRALVEGQKIYEDEESDEDVAEDEAKRREVFLIKDGNLALMSLGVSGFEGSLEKRLEKLSLS